MRAICENDGCGYEGESRLVPDPNDDDNSDGAGCIRAGCASVAIAVLLMIVTSFFVEDHMDKGFTWWIAIIGALLIGGLMWFGRKEMGRKIHVCPECNPTGRHHSLSVFRVGSPAAQSLQVRRAKIREEARRYEYEEEENDPPYNPHERYRYIWRDTNGQDHE